jgi:hypothetical protein
MRVNSLCCLNIEKRWLTLTYKGKDAGSLLIETKYTPSAQEFWDTTNQTETTMK